MGTLRDEIMLKLHGQDVWQNLDFPIRSRSAPQGWGGDHPSLSRLAQGGACVADIGVWKGDSTITLATAMKTAGINGCVIAVDTFLGSPEHYVDNRFSNLFGRVSGRPDLYETFMSNVIGADVTDIIVPLPQTSASAAAIMKALDIRPDLIHIDAAHEYEDVLRDAHIYWDLLTDGGFLIGDDYIRDWPGVVKAAGEFSASLGLPLTVEMPKWIIRKPDA